MIEYIKREDAIDKIIECVGEDEADYLEGVLHLVPSADVIERKNGKWKAASEDLIICTSCKCGFLLPYPNRIEEAKTVYGWNFCPNCGARMDTERGEE